MRADWESNQAECEECEGGEKNEVTIAIRFPREGGVEVGVLHVQIYK